jgi:sporulation protein YlmC with PRC-barrel domain
MRVLAQGNDEGSGLVRLEDFQGELEEPWQDVQSLKVFDKNGDEVGTVEDLYVYADAEAAHLLKVTGNEGTILIPVDAVTNASEEGVNIEQDKDLILGAPKFDSKDVPDSDTSRAAYAHFGYPDQLAL